MNAIFARDMYAAQGFRPTAADRADLTACADRIREIIGSDARQSISVPVKDPATMTTIGHLTFQNL